MGSLARFATCGRIRPDTNGSMSRVQPPWQEESRERLGWLVANGGEMWLPTVEEQDAAWRQYSEENRQRIGRRAATTLA
jgi:hypothetical protein